MANKYDLMINIGGKLNGSLANATSAANKSLSGMQRSANLLKTAIIGAVGYVSVNSVVNFGKACVAAAEDQIDAETKLMAVLKNVKSIQAKGPEAYIESAKVLQTVASNLQKVGVIGDEVTLSGMQQLATFQMSDEQISVLSSGMTDLLAQQKGLNATQEDAVTIANMIGKAMDGNVGALSRVGISFTDAQAEAIKTGDATQRAATIAEVLQNNVGGVNAALAATDQGKIQQVTNAWGDMKEKIGGKLLPVIASVMSYINDRIPTIESKIEKVSTFINTNVKPVIASIAGFVREHMETIKAVIETAFSFMKATISSAFAVIKGLFSFISEHQVAFKTLAGSILAVVAAITIWKAVTTAISMVTKAFTAVQFALNIVMAANPIVLIVLAIVALVAAFVVLWNKCDAFRNFWIGLWDGIKKVFTNVFNAIRGFFEKWGMLILMFVAPFIAVPLLIVKHWDTIKVFMAGVWEGIKGVFSSAGAWFSGIFSGAWEGIKSAFSSVGAFFQGIWDTITDMFTSIGTTIGNAIGGAFAAVVNAIIGFAETIINGFINSINLAISLINAIPGVNISPLTPLAIPRLAEGGIATSATLAMIGEGNESEAVLPLSKLSAMLDAPKANNSTTDEDYTVVFAPVQNFYGSVNKADVAEANSASFAQFKAWYQKMKDDERRKAFVPG